MQKMQQISVCRQGMVQPLWMGQQKTKKQQQTTGQRFTLILEAGPECTAGSEFIMEATGNRQCSAGSEFIEEPTGHRQCQAVMDATCQMECKGKAKT
jgi:hypothetical protein